jgi:hypothetical protein
MDTVVFAVQLRTEVIFRTVNRREYLLEYQPCLQNPSYATNR